jgi:hypothetical protein
MRYCCHDRGPRNADNPVRLGRHDLGRLVGLGRSFPIPLIQPRRSWEDSRWPYTEKLNPASRAHSTTLGSGFLRGLRDLRDVMLWQWVTMNAKRLIGMR